MAAKAPRAEFVYLFFGKVQDRNHNMFAVTVSSRHGGVDVHLPGLPVCLDVWVDKHSLRALAATSAVHMVIGQDCVSGEQEDGGKVGGGAQDQGGQEEEGDCPVMHGGDTAGRHLSL